MVGHDPASPPPRLTAPTPRGRLGWRRRTQLAGQTAVELARLLRATGRWWLVPMLVILGASAILLGLVQVIEVAAPFVYTIF